VAPFRVSQLDDSLAAILFLDVPSVTPFRVSQLDVTFAGISWLDV
jgi:hypothetical protein